MDVQSSPFYGLPIISFIEEQKKSLSAPFGIIRKIVSNERIWGNILTEACEIAGTRPNEQMLTSCSINQIALNLLFIGKERTKELTLKITHGSTQPIRLHVDGKEKYIYLVHLLSGNEVLALNTESPFHKEAQGDYAKVAQKFFQTIPCNALSANPTFDKSFYGHNENVLNRLKSEIILNEKDVLFDCSIIYSVFIASPDLKVLKHGTLDEIKKTSNPHHTFILEQYRSENGKVFIRLHNSWVNEYSLSQFYKTQNYNDGDEGCFSPEMTQTFLDVFGKMLCCGDFELERLAEYQHYCFKVLDAAPSPLPFVSRTSDGIFSGISLRYITSKINPIEVTARLQSTFNV